MVTPWHHGRVKVQDTGGRVKAGASDGWKESMRGPDRVREEKETFSFTQLRKGASGEIVPSAMPCSSP